MKQLKQYYSITFLCIVFFSCSTSKSNQKPILGKRYNTIIPSVPKNDTEALIDIFTTVLPPDEKNESNNKTVFELTGDGQKAYIRAISEKSKDDLDKFTSLMNSKYLSDVDDKANDVENLTTKNIRLIFSTTEKQNYSKIPMILSLGDRIEYLKIGLRLDTPSVLKFSNWDKFNTQYGELNIGSRSFTNTREVNINPSIPFTGGAGGSLTIGSLDNKKDYVENDSIIKRFIQFNGILQEDSFIIEQSGNSGIDLTGNSSVDLTLNLKNDDTGKDIDQYFVFGNLKSKNSFSDPKAVKVLRTLNYYPQLNRDLTATITCDYALRHIIKGAETFGENDDDIQYYYGSFTKKIVLIKKQQAKPPKFGITLNKLQLLLRNTITKNIEEISFVSFREAENFKTWLMYTIPNVPASGKLIIDNYELITKDVLTNVITNINGSSNISDVKIDNID